MKMLSIKKILHIIFLLCTTINPNLFASDYLIIKTNQTELYPQHLPIQFFLDEKTEITTPELALEKYNNGEFSEPLFNPNLGYTNAIAWFAFKLNLDGKEKRNWIITIDPPTLDFIQLYQFDHNGNMGKEKKISGDGVKLDFKDLEYFKPGFKIILSPGENVILFKVKTTSQMSLVTKLKEEESFWKESIFDGLLYGFFYGAIVIALLLGAIARIVTKLKIYTLFIIYLVLIFLFWFFYDGLAGYLFFPNNPIEMNKAFGILFCVGYLIANILVKSSLEVPKEHYFINLFILGINTLIVISGISIFFGLFKFLFPLLLLSIVFIYAVFASYAIKNLKNKDASNKIFSTGYLLFGFANTLTVLMNIGLIGLNELNLSSAKFSQIIFIVTLHISLFSKFRNLEVINIKTQINIERLRNKIRIDKKQKKDQDNLFQMINHELRTPVSIIKSCVDSLIILDRKNNINEDPSRIKRYEKIINGVERVKNLLNNITSLSLFDLNNKNNITKINLSDELDEALRPYSNIKSRFIINNQLINSFILFRSNYLNFILINLLDNAIKYSPKNTKIKILMCNKLINNKKAVVFELSNLIQNNSVIDNKLLFEKYKRFNNNKIPGLGIGLYLSKEIIEKHSSKIISLIKNKRFTIKILFFDL